MKNFCKKDSESILHIAMKYDQILLQFLVIDSYSKNLKSIFDYQHGINNYVSTDLSKVEL